MVSPPDSPAKTGGAPLAARTATAYSPQKAQRELEDLQLVLKARNGDGTAMDALMRRYAGFVRLKASSYFLAGGDSEDLIQEGLIGLYKAVRDFRPDKETSFRSFAELCVTRQIITAIKTATRFKHSPLNTYVSFSHTPAGQESEGECTLGDALPGPGVDEPSVCVISTEELQSLVFCLGTRPLAARVGRAPPLPRGLVLRGHGRAARLRHEDDRQRAPAREAQDHHAPEGARSPPVARRPVRCALRAGVAQLAEHRSCKPVAVGSSPTSGSSVQSARAADASAASAASVSGSSSSMRALRT